MPTPPHAPSPTPQDPTARRLAGFGTTVFTEMTELANRHGAVNLGQGFPDFDGPLELLEAAVEALRSGANQYSPGPGAAELRQAISRHRRELRGVSYAPDTEVTVTCGATEAIFSTLQALCNPGDGVVLFEPFYDSYRASVAMAGGVERVVTLRDPDFSFDPAELEAAVTPATRLLVLNTPHNPTGKLFGLEELEVIADLARRRDLIVLADEVHEHLVFEGEHRSIAALPGMRERTVVFGSAGKTFSCTGWKIGWAVAPEPLSRAIRSAHQFVTFCAATPLQLAVARTFERCLSREDDYFARFRAEFTARRDKLCQGLEEVGFGVRRPSGTYFTFADIRPLGWDDDLAFCRWLPEEIGVAAIPPSSFYAHPEEGRHLVRFAFCKTDPVLDEALARLRKLEPRTP